MVSARFDMRAMARRKVHQTFAVPIRFFPKNTKTELGLLNPLTARLHNRAVVDPDNTGQGAAQIVDTNTRILFNTEELASVPLIPAPGDRVQFPDDGRMFRLDTKERPSGPIVEKWTVSQV